MKFLKSLASVSTLLCLMACVTVNIYFPEAAAEQALRGVARDILNEPASGGTPAPAAQPSPGASLNIGRVLAVLLMVPEAQAEEQPSINVQTPVAQKLKASLKERQAKLAPYYRIGAIGLSSNFQPAAREIAQVPLNERVTLQKLLADDARDRNALFEEIARANGHPEWQQNLKTTFDRVFFEELPAGYWYQDAQGKWHQK